MKDYIVAICWLFDNRIEQFKVQADNEAEAIRTALVLYDDNWIDWQLDLHGETGPEIINELHFQEYNVHILELAADKTVVITPADLNEIVCQ